MKRKTEQQQIKHSLYKVVLYNGEPNLWIIADSPSQAMHRAELVLGRKGKAFPEITTIDLCGSVDYIPSLKAAHLEF